jgi:polyhydroxyalkanoate synthase
LIVPSIERNPIMWDLQPGRSVVEKFLSYDFNVYIVDWTTQNHNSISDLTLENYVFEFLNGCVEYILQKHTGYSINLLGEFLGGVLGVIYSCLFPKKVKNLITVTTPTYFSTNKGLYHILLKSIPVDNLSSVFRFIHSDVKVFYDNLLNPARLLIDKYVGYIENHDHAEFEENFLRMEEWIHSNSDIPIEVFKKIVRDLYQNDFLIKNEMVLGGMKVDLKQICCPVLNFFGKYDHIVPPEACDKLTSKIGSRDKEDICFDTGHIGIYVSSKCQRSFVPKIIDFLSARD